MIRKGGAAEPLPMSIGCEGGEAQFLRQREGGPIPEGREEGAYGQMNLFRQAEGDRHDRLAGSGGRQ